MAGQDGGAAYFTDRQLLAVRTTDANVLLIAPAGTGKTQVTAAKYVHVAKAHGAGSVLGITFTKKAGKNLLDRITELAYDGGKPVGWMSGARRSVGTFHAICKRLLREGQQKGLYEGPMTLADEAEQRHYAIQALRERRPEEQHRTVADNKRDPRDLAAMELIGTLEHVKNAGVVPVEGGYAWPSGEPAETPKGAPHPGSRAHGDAVHYESVLHGAGSMDFNDVILYATALVENHRDALLPELKAVLVDEYQDTNDPQERLIRALSRGLHLTCVGDDDQSIFQWRGANVGNIRTFEARYPGSIVVTLDVNYRCPREILEPALRLINNNPDRQKKPVRADKSVPSGTRAVTVHDLTAKYANAGFQGATQLKSSFLPQFTAQVCRDLLRGGVRAGELACLVRTNQEAQNIEAELRNMGVATRITNPNTVSSRPLRHLTAWMRVLENPRDLSAVATLTDSRSGDSVLMDLLDGAKAAGETLATHVAALAEGGKLRQRRLTAFGEAYARYVGLKGRMGPAELAAAIAGDVSSDRSTLTDEVQARHFWKTFAMVSAELEGAVDLDPAIDFLQTQFLSDEGDGEGDDVMEIATAHSMKGRQKRVVVASAFIDGVFPLGGGGRSTKAALAEERNLAYVVMTRAQERLHIVTTSTGAATFLREAGLSVEADGERLATA
jgi:superfamily I DNA/RNA helicase